MVLVPRQGSEPRRGPGGPWTLWDCRTGWCSRVQTQAGNPPETLLSQLGRRQQRSSLDKFTWAKFCLLVGHAGKAGGNKLKWQGGVRSTRKTYRVRTEQRTAVPTLRTNRTWPQLDMGRLASIEMCQGFKTFRFHQQLQTMKSDILRPPLGLVIMNSLCYYTQPSFNISWALILGLLV